MEQSGINYKKIIIICSVLAGVSTFFAWMGLVGKLVEFLIGPFGSDEKGLGGGAGIAVAFWVLFGYYPLLIFVSGIISALIVRQRRIASFFVGIGFSLLINVILVRIFIYIKWWAQSVGWITY